MKDFTILILTFLFLLNMAIDGRSQTSYAINTDFYSSGVDTRTIEIRTIAKDRVASFRNGDKSLTRYIKENFKYPAIAQENGVEGVTKVRFRVKANGNISDLIIVESVHEVIDCEVVKLINNMPKWIPRIKNGQEVDSSIELDIAHSLK